MAKILIVEDDLKTAREVSRQLKAAGHRCAIEPAGSRVLELLHKHECDILLLDIMLPDVSGFEVCRRVRRDAELYGIPIMILSAMNSEEEVMHGLHQGADDYLAKPFNLQNLQRRVEALLNTSASNGEIDAVTGLLGPGSTRRELQRQLSVKKGFAVAYVELLNLRPFAYDSGPDARTKPLKLMADCLKACSDKLLEGHMLGHMGGGHFVLTLDANKVKPLYTAIKQHWDKELPTLYNSLHKGQAYEDASSGKKTAKPLLAPLFLVTDNVDTLSVSPNQVFDLLASLRSRRQGYTEGSLLIDQRSRG